MTLLFIQNTSLPLEIRFCFPNALLFDFDHLDLRLKFLFSLNQLLGAELFGDVDHQRRIHVDDVVVLVAEKDFITTLVGFGELKEVVAVFDLPSEGTIFEHGG